MRRYDLHQDNARRNTARLCFWMCIAQTMTVAMVAVVFGYLVAVYHFITTPETVEVGRTFLTASLFVGVVTAIFIAGATIWKLYELKSGGQKVAEMLRAQRIPELTNNPQQRQLLNIVEELAISSGIRVPPVYIMRGESGINALAAGHRPGDAVIVVTEGACKRLSRDQMQGVMAHEFAHILNGDIGRNMLLMSLTHGNFALLLVADAALEGNGGETADPTSNIIGLILRPLGLMAAGMAMFFMALIKRQGEFNADAIAVELTRHPDGLSEALMAIGGHHTNSRVRSTGAVQASHLFFANSSWSAAHWFDPHPPLDERIIRLRPQWEGNYFYENDDEIEDYEAAYQDVVDLIGGANSKSKLPNAVTVAGAAAMLATATSSATASSTQQDAVEDDVPEWVSADAEYQVSIDPIYLKLANDPTGAGLVLAAIRLNQFDADKTDSVLASMNPAIASQVKQLLPRVEEMDDAQKLTLFDQALEATGAAPAMVRTLLSQFVEQTSISPTEETCVARWAWQWLVARKLSGPHKKPDAHFGKLSDLLAETGILVSAVIHTDCDSESVGQYAYMRATAHTGLSDTNMLPADDCSLEQVEFAIDRLQYAAAREKRKLLVACGTSLTSNREIVLNEAWILRVICCGLHYPTPKLVPGQPVAPGA